MYNIERLRIKGGCGMGGLTDKQLQEMQNCKGICEQCSVMNLRGDKPCFDFVVGELVLAKTELQNAKDYIKDSES
jgi:hypothetical protein